MFTVEYAPGGRSSPHVHEGDVFVYVLEGSVVMQIEGDDAIELGPGDLFLEKPGDIHRQSANASDTQPAKFLVVILKSQGELVTQPLIDAVALRDAKLRKPTEIRLHRVRSPNP